jgi:hypothetical protein
MKAPSRPVQSATGPLRDDSAHIHRGRAAEIQRSGVARWIGASVDVPLAHVASVSAAHPRDVKDGIRIAGIRLPGLMTSGIYRHGGQLTWWDVGRGSTAIVITLRDEQLGLAVVEVDDHATVLQELDQAVADSDYALLIVAASQSSAPSIGIGLNPEWVPAPLNPVGRANAIFFRGRPRDVSGATTTSCGRASARPCAYRRVTTAR